MDLNNLTKMLNEKFGTDVDTSKATEALSGLMGKEGLGSLVDKLQNAGLVQQAKSWLGDGDNIGISAEEIKGAFNAEEIKGFAEKVGVEVSSAADALSDLLPNIIDKSSEGGSLLDNLGGLEDRLKNLAGKFFS